MARKLNGVLAIALLSVCALAQGAGQTTGEIRGAVFVVDDDGGRSVIPSVKVSLTGRTKHETKSDDRVNFSLIQFSPATMRFPPKALAWQERET